MIFFTINLNQSLFSIAVYLLHELQTFISSVLFSVVNVGVVIMSNVINNDFSTRSI